ncbi:MAG: BRO family protein [Pseudomonadota bacterium]
MTFRFDPIGAKDAQFTNGTGWTGEETGHDIRVVLKEGAAWFVVADICRAMDVYLKASGKPDATNACRRLDDDEKGFSNISTLGGPQKMAIVSESGMYGMSLGAQSPKARPFQRWVRKELLPALRKHGTYSLQGSEMPNLPSSMAEALRLAADLAEKNEVLQADLAEAAPKADVVDKTFSGGRRGHSWLG